MIDSQRAVTLMQQQIGKAIENLPFDDSQVTIWFQVTERIVEEAFGQDHSNFKRFRYTVSHYSASRSVHQQDYTRNLRDKKAMLTAFIDELTLFPSSSATNQPDLPQLRRKLLSDIVEASRSSSQSPSGRAFVNYKYLPMTTTWSLSFIFEQLEILEAEGRVELKRLGNSDECNVKPTANGKRSLEVEEQEWQKRHQPIVHNSSVTVNNHNSTIGNQSQVAGAQHMQIHQTSSSVDLKNVFEMIEGLLDRVKASGAAPETKQDAELEAAQLKNELQKSKPNANRIKEILAWFGTLNGVVQFGEHLPGVIHAVNHLLHTL